MISICITIKNRSRVQVQDEELLLLPNCVNSIAACLRAGISCELIVTDFSSNDWPLKDWVEQAALPVPVKLIKVDGAFNRGKGLNAAAKASDSSNLFFTDADVLISPEVLQRGIACLENSKAYFPVVFYFNDTTHKEGWWNHYSYGNCFVTKTMYEQSGGWPEYQSWGKEDDDFYAAISKHAEAVREEAPGFYHQWHPDDMIWKNMYAEKAEEIAHEILEVEEAKKELSKLLLPGENFILVDEARFGGSDCIEGHIAIPFTELNGEYGGAPIDSEAAKQEFECLTKKGPAYIVFAWMAFWWLDHYAEFTDFIESRFDCIIRSNRLIVFSIIKNSKRIEAEATNEMSSYKR